MIKKSKISLFLENKTGFTLIELLVSISIIAILTALLTANFVGARQRGRDGQRKANLYNIQSALELYRADNSSYPLDSAFPACGNPLELNGVVYMQEVPCDPSAAGTSYTYISSDGLTYTLYACLENEADSEISTDGGDTDNITGCDTAGNTSFPFKLTNP